MRKFELLLAGALAFSPALFAQQSTPQSDSQNATQSTAPSTQSGSQTAQTPDTSKAKLTADQRAELKQLRDKAKEACKADKKSDACKSARQDLRSKANEYGVQRHGRKGMKSGSTTQSPS